MEYRNPVISGCFPDPSICRKGDTYYLVCSSFQFFPGVPLFESRDLVNWTQLGHVLTRPSQLPLQNADSVGGIYAPTIRYDAASDYFYMVTTNVTNGGHFYVRTRDIYGEWSEPFRVGQQGIDPSLFFEDGKTYFMSNGSDEQGSCILQCEIDPDTGKALTAARPVWRGTGGRFLESPHLYRIGKYYYLMASEGGTEYGHMVVYARGTSPYGPFEAYAENPVLTNRNLGGYLLQGCGHADLVDDPQGNWWMVHLGFRQIHRWMMFHTTGREVCLAPVTFDRDGWFTAGSDGTNRLTIQTDRIPETVTQQIQTHFDMANTAVGREWVYLQNPAQENYRLTADRYSLCGTAHTLSDAEQAPTFLGIRQKEMEFRFSAALSRSKQEAGLTVYMTSSQHYDLFVKDELVTLRAVLGTLVHEQAVFPVPADAETVTLEITGTPLSYGFSVKADRENVHLGDFESKYVSTEVAGNFTGVLLGLYATGSGNAWTDFTDVTLDNILPSEPEE